MQRYIFFCTYKDFLFFLGGGDCETPYPLHTSIATEDHQHGTQISPDLYMAQLPHSTEKTYIQLLPEKQKIRPPKKNAIPALPATQKIIIIL